MSEIQRYDFDKAWGIERNDQGIYVEYDDHAAIVAQLEAELAQSQAALKMAREWSKGDKWRFSEVAQEYAAWENYVDVLDAAIKKQQDHIPNVGKMVQSQAQQPSGKPYETLSDLLPQGFTWGDYLTPDTVLHIALAANLKQAQAQQKPEVCSDGGKCGAGGYCITCPNMLAPEGEKT